MSMKQTQISPEMAEIIYGDAIDAIDKLALEEVIPDHLANEMVNLVNAVSLLGNVLHILAHINIHSLREGIAAAHECEAKSGDNHGGH